MPPLSSVLVVVAIAAGTFFILAVLVSHLRYQGWLYQAEEQSHDLCTTDAAHLLILDRLRTQRVGIIRITLPSPGSAEQAEWIRSALRKTDTVWRMETGELCLVLFIESHHLPAVRNRLTTLLEEKGIRRGRFTLSFPEAQPDSVRDALRVDPSPCPETGWAHLPAEWPTEAEPADIPDSPSIDPLTRTLSSSRTPRAVRGVLASHQRRNQPLSLLRVDVDHLREYNEGPSGHKAGDAVLREVAAVLMRNCREEDLVARLEEDEFLICMRENAETALRAARRISEAVKQAHVEVDAIRLRFTVSIGIATFPEHGSTPQALVIGAGWARSAAASRGRASCLILTPDMRPQVQPSPSTDPASPEHF